MSLPLPPPYKRTVWHYSKANVQSNPFTPSEMVDHFTKTLYAIMSLYIPNETIRINDKDPPWLTSELKTAI